VQYSGNIVYDTVSAGGLNLLGQQICVTNSSGLQSAFTAETNVKRSRSDLTRTAVSIVDSLVASTPVIPHASVSESSHSRERGDVDDFFRREDEHSYPPFGDPHELPRPPSLMSSVSESSQSKERGDVEVVRAGPAPKDAREFTVFDKHNLPIFCTN